MSTHVISSMLNADTQRRQQWHFVVLFQSKAKKRKCLVSRYPTDPNILGPTQTFFEDFRDNKV